jgi:hypothetical protein
MKSFLNELRIIPPIVWPVALLISGGSFYFFCFYLAPKDPFMNTWSRSTLYSTAAWSTCFFFICVLLIGYVYADAKRRGMRYVMWTLLTIFVIYGIGFILYFVLREPILVQCPKCSAQGRSGFIFCPQCGAELAASCSRCKRAVEPDWKRCVYCGLELDQAVKPEEAATLSR